MVIVEEIRNEIGDAWIPEIYKGKIRSQRTRSHSLDVLQKENSAEILHTLLGIELRIKKKRFACPDLSTARYLRIFARIGCNDFAIPYDISRISSVADELEASWHRMILVLESKTKSQSPQVAGRIRAALIRRVRDEILEIGAGPAIPRFKKSTKQRKT